MQSSNTALDIGQVQATVAPQGSSQVASAGQFATQASGLGVLVLPHGTSVQILPSQQPQVSFIILPQIPADSFMIPAGLVNVKIQPRDADSQDESLIFNKIKIYTDVDEDTSSKKRPPGEKEKRKPQALLLLLMSIVSASLASQQLITWSKVREKKRARQTTSPYSSMLLKEFSK